MASAVGVRQIGRSGPSRKMCADLWRVGRALCLGEEGWLCYYRCCEECSYREAVSNDMRLWAGSQSAGEPDAKRVLRTKRTLNYDLMDFTGTSTILPLSQITRKRTETVREWSVEVGESG